MPSGHPPTPNPLIVGNCIACSGLVRVSATANANADVRCPHCQQAFPLARLLESAVPEVEVVEPHAPVKKPTQNLYIDQTAETTKDASGKFVVPSQLAKGARRRKSSRSRSNSSRSRSSSSSSETERSSRHRSDSRSHGDARPSSRRKPSPQEQLDERVDETSRRTRHPENESRNAPPPGIESLDREPEPLVQPRGSSDHSELPLSSHRSTRHRDARAAEAHNAQSNPAADFFKMLVGACLALPIAYLIVMWVFSQDPLGIGRGLGEKLPFLVPSALRADAEYDADNDNDTPVATDQSFLDFGDDDGSLKDSFERINIGGEALKGLDL